MSITLNWSYKTNDDSETKIYRSESMIDEQALPVPVDTVGTGVRTYVDATTDPGKVYFYRFGKVTTEGEELSDNFSYFSSEYRGPGPQQLSAGNYHSLGVFGWTDVKDLFTTHELCDLTGIDLQTINDKEPWLKVFFDGKVQYFRLKTSGWTNRSWEDLYRAGLVFEGPGAHETEVSADIITVIGAHEQGKVIQKNLDRFKPRLLSAMPSTAEWVTGVNRPEWDGSEFNRLLYPLLGRFEQSQEAIVDPDIILSPYPLVNDILCAETNGTSVHVRDRNSPQVGKEVNYNNNSYWFPIIEYLPNA